MIEMVIFMTEFEILSFIHKNKNFIEYGDLVKESVFQNDPDFLSDDLRWNYLLAEGYISGVLDSGAPLSLTTKGIMRLDELTHQEREKKQQRRHEWLIAIFSSLVGALLSEPLWAIINALID